MYCCPGCTSAMMNGFMLVWHQFNIIKSNNARSSSNNKEESIMNGDAVRKVKVRKQHYNQYY